MKNKIIKCSICKKKINKEKDKYIFLEAVDEEGTELGKGYRYCSKKCAMKDLLDYGFTKEEAEEKIENEN